MDWPKLEPNPHLVFLAPDCVRLRGSRIDLADIVEWYQNGLSPEQMVNDYPPLTLEAVYHVIAYYLSHQDSVDRYVACHRDASEQAYREHLKKPRPPVVERLLALKQALKYR